MKIYLMLGAAAFALAACKLDNAQPTAAPQFAAAAPFDLGLAPGYDALPMAAQPIPIAYAPQPVAQTYWNDAYSLGQAYYDQPPSYFPYNGATPLVWNQGDAISRIVEALVGGGQREYYYQPGAAYPFFVRDPQYAYAYDDGQLISVYDPMGQVLPLALVQQRAPIAAQYLTRAQTLYDVARRTNPRPLTPKVWDVERARLAKEVDNPGWKSWWTPGDNRSPVAVQRLADVRERKIERDLAHDAWKADATRLKADRKEAKADEHPQYRAEAAPPGKRLHGVLAPAERPKKIEQRAVHEKRAVERREVKAPRAAPAAVEHGRPAAFHGGDKKKPHEGHDKKH
jgi:hypothetical protein